MPFKCLAILNGSTFKFRSKFKFWSMLARFHVSSKKERTQEVKRVTLHIKFTWGGKKKFNEIQTCAEYQAHWVSNFNNCRRHNKSTRKWCFKILSSRAFILNFIYFIELSHQLKMKINTFFIFKLLKKKESQKRHITSQDLIYQPLCQGFTIEWNKVIYDAKISLE